MKLRNLLEKLKESMLSVLPVCAITLLLGCLPIVDLSGTELLQFALSSASLVLGMALFSLGAETAMTPMGEFVGSGLARSGKLGTMLGVAFVMGLLITVAEPDLSVLASQLAPAIDKTLLIYAVGFGVGLLLLVAVAKIVFKKDLAAMLLFFYFLVFAVISVSAVEGKTALLALSFDSGGVTTGPITVPFIMALGVGISFRLGGKNVSENSFGLIALCSVGPVLAVLVLALFSHGTVSYTVPDYAFTGLSLRPLLEITGNVCKAVGLVFVIFLLLDLFLLKIPKKELLKMTAGLLITVAGLVIFLTAVETGFMPTGYKIGACIARYSGTALVAVGFVLGTVVVLAEPAVHVLNNQVEEVTKGMIPRKSMLIALCSGVGLSIGLSMLRIVLDFSVLYYLIPGYVISLGLSLLVPRLYTGIAFDSGGVASGPMTSCYILPFSIGACVVLQGEGKVLSDAFGIVAMVAMTPLITIQCLGFGSVVRKLFRQRKAIRRIYGAEDRQVIRF